MCVCVCVCVCVCERERERERERGREKYVRLFGFIAYQACLLFNAESILIQVNSSVSYNSF